MFESLKKKVADELFRKDEGVVTSSKSVIANPLNLQLGSLFTIANNNSIIYKSLFKKKKEYTVVGIGVSSFTAMTKTFRFYCTPLEKEQILPADNFLQIIISERTDEIIECRMFSFVENVFPRNDLEWRTWYGQAGSKIGNITVEFDGREFARMESWAVSDGEWSPALNFKERIYEDNQGGIIDYVEHNTMAYGRWLHEEHQVAEFVLLSSDKVNISRESKAYKTHLDQIEGITVYAGLDIDVKEVKVTF